MSAEKQVNTATESVARLKQQLAETERYAAQAFERKDFNAWRLLHSQANEIEDRIYGARRLPIT